MHSPFKRDCRGCAPIYPLIADIFPVSANTHGSLVLSADTEGSHNAFAQLQCNCCKFMHSCYSKRKVGRRRESLSLRGTPANSRAWRHRSQHIRGWWVGDVGNYRMVPGDAGWWMRWKDGREARAINGSGPTNSAQDCWQVLASQARNTDVDPLDT